MTGMLETWVIQPIVIHKFDIHFRYVGALVCNDNCGMGGIVTHIPCTKVSASMSTNILKTYRIESHLHLLRMQWEQTRGLRYNWLV